MREERERQKKAKKEEVIAAAEESVNMLSAPSLILSVCGTADDADDINKYAIICIIHNLTSMDSYKL